MSYPNDPGRGGATGPQGAAQHPNAQQDVIAVDENDNEQGLVNRLEAHSEEGIRHRAFTVLVYDAEDNILLAQRSPDKRLWATYWDGTVASHPGQGQSQTEAAAERLEQELDIERTQYNDLRVTDKFEYKRYFENAGVEHEVCAVLKLTLTDRSISPNPAEVAGVLWAPADRLTNNPQWYRQLRLCPWFKIALRRDADAATTP